MGSGHTCSFQTIFWNSTSWKLNFFPFVILCHKFVHLFDILKIQVHHSEILEPDSTTQDILKRWLAQSFNKLVFSCYAIFSDFSHACEDAKLMPSLIINSLYAKFYWQRLPWEWIDNWVTMPTGKLPVTTILPAAFISLNTNCSLFWLPKFLWKLPFKLACKCADLNTPIHTNKLYTVVFPLHCTPPKNLSLAPSQVELNAHFFFKASSSS